MNKTISILSIVLFSTFVLTGCNNLMLNHKNYLETVMTDNTSVTLSLDDESPINFENGSKTKNFTVGSILSESDFDTSNINDGRKLIGVSVVENGQVNEVISLSDFQVEINQKIVPIFSQVGDYTSMTPSYVGSGKINFDGVVGTFAINNALGNTLDKTPDSPIKGDDGYYEKGVTFIEDKFIDIGSALRFDSGTSVINSSAVYEFRFNFENKGTEEIHLDGYQISASSEYKNFSKAYESRYRMDIDLKPGEAKTYVAQYQLGKNDNALTYLIADESMGSMNLGMSMSIKKLSISAPTTISSAEIEDRKGTIDFRLPDGVTISDDFVIEGLLGSSVIVPTDSQVVNDTEYELTGWYDTRFPDRKIDFRSVLPEHLTLAPLLTPLGQVATPGVSGTETLPDYFVHFTNEVSDGGDLGRNKFTTESLTIDGAKGRQINYPGTINKDEAFRLKTYLGTSGSDLGIKKDVTYRYDYRLLNNGDSTISFKIIHVQGTTKIKESDGAVHSENIVLEPNEIKYVTIFFKLNVDNENICPFIYMNDSTENLKLGITLSRITCKYDNPTSISDINTRVSLIVKYNSDNDNPISSAALRFGATLDRTEYYSDNAEYGVIFAPKESLKGKTYKEYLDSLNTNDIISLKNSIENAKLEKCDGAFVDTEVDKEGNVNGKYFQFAVVINGLEKYLTNEITATCYCVVNGKLSLMNERTFSVASIAKEYIDSNVLGDAASSDQMKVLEYLAGLIK